MRIPLREYKVTFISAQRSEVLTHARCFSLLKSDKRNIHLYRSCPSTWLQATEVQLFLNLTSEPSHNRTPHTQFTT